MVQGILIGRFAPLQLGHEALIRMMIAQHGVEHSLVIIGSSNTTDTDRTPYSSHERQKFIATVFPGLDTALLSDYPTDPEWLEDLDNVLAKRDIDPSTVVFWGGSDNDVAILKQAGRSVMVIDRSTGITPKISATEVRAALKQGDPIHDLVSPQIEAVIMQSHDRSLLQ